MKTKIKAVVLSCLLAASLSSTFAQGSLTPPGAPAPTMKTLAQIEPRTLISSAPFTISAPGSYYLTTNLFVSSGNAITIASSDVTLDLNGFTIASSAASAAGTGILLNSSVRNISIANGHIGGGVFNNGSGTYSGTGFASGITYSDTSPANVLVSRVTVSGCLYYGINLGYGVSTVVESCTVQTAGSIGIYGSTIKQSVATDCGGTAIYGVVVSDCHGESTGSGAGVSAFTANNCYGSSSSGAGVSATTANNCYGYSISGTGVYCGGGTANGCYGYSSTGTGLSAFIATSCHGVSSSGVALSVTHSLNTF